MDYNSAWWVSSKEFLPDEGEKVLIISKFGHVSLSTFTSLGYYDCPLFMPEGFKPHVDVKWWMRFPVDGWNDFKVNKPVLGQSVLVMGMYGRVFSGKWTFLAGAKEPEFVPFVFPVLFWRVLPDLPY